MLDPHYDPPKDVGRARCAAIQKIAGKRRIWAQETDAKAFDAFWKRRAQLHAETLAAIEARTPKKLRFAP